MGCSGEDPRRQWKMSKLTDLRRQQQFSNSLLPTVFSFIYEENYNIIFCKSGRHFLTPFSHPYLCRGISVLLFLILRNSIGRTSYDNRNFHSINKTKSVVFPIPHDRSSIMWENGRGRQYCSFDPFFASAYLHGTCTTLMLFSSLNNLWFFFCFQPHVHVPDEESWNKLRL